MTTRLTLRRAPVFTLASALLLAGGCRVHSDSVPEVDNSFLRRVVVPAGASEADEDRAALSRFVGVWNFQGWSGPAKSPASGVAAAAIEHEHFVRLDLRSDSGQMGGRVARVGGTMILASEPGVGLTLTALGDASPAVSRLFGSADAQGGQFVFHEAPTPGGTPRVTLTIRFETDDRWVAEMRERGTDTVAARYEFSRAAP